MSARRAAPPVVARSQVVPVLGPVLIGPEIAAQVGVPFYRMGSRGRLERVRATLTGGRS